MRRTPSRLICHATGTGRRVLLLSVSCSLLLLAGCGASAAKGAAVPSLSGTPTPQALTPTANLTPSANLAQSTWTLTRLIVDGREQLLVPGHAPTLHFDPFNGQYYGIRGTGGCNGYGGDYTLAGNMFRVDSLSYTQMACGVGVDLVESAYFQALLQVTRYHLDGSALTLTSADASVQLTFRAN
jgi:heat shock protein HslJ